MVAHKGDSTFRPPAQQAVGLAVLPLQPPVLAALDCLLQHALVMAGEERERERERGEKQKRQPVGQNRSSAVVIV
jgi:hypothetical protein